MNLLMNKIEQNYRYLKSGKKSLVDICKSINVSPQDRRELLRMANDAMNQYEDYRVSQYGFGMAGSDKEYKGRGDEFNYDMSDDDMMMESKKQHIRLTESELKNIITESVKNILMEHEWYNENPNQGAFPQDLEMAIRKTYRSVDELFTLANKYSQTLEDNYARRDADRIKDVTLSLMNSLHSYIPGKRMC